MTTVSSQWKNWVLQCLLTRVPIEEVATTLSQNGFVPHTIRQLLGANLPPALPLGNDTPFFTRLANSFESHNGSCSNNANPSGNKTSSHDALLSDPSQLSLYAVEHFLSEQECDDIIALTRGKLTPSSLAGAASSENIRTSSTCELAQLNSRVVQCVERRIVDRLQLGVGEQEVIQAQHYQVGEYYKPHYDFFPPGTPQYLSHCASRGQRTWTCMIYLNEDCEGGHTRFTKLGISVKPQKGKALFWNNLLPTGEPNLNSIHYAEPVTRGNKTVITKWFRSKN